MPAADVETSPKVGLKKPAGKKVYSGEEVSRAFERGAVTLAGVIGVTDAQRDALKAKVFTLLKDHRTKDAVPLLQGLVALDPFDLWVLTTLAAVQIDAGDLKLAKALLDRAAEVDSKDAASRALRAEVKFKEGDVAGAVKDVVALAGSDVPAVRRVRSLLEVNNVSLVPEVEPATVKMKRPTSQVASQSAQDPKTNPSLKRPTSDPVTTPMLKRPSSQASQSAVTNSNLSRPPSKKS